MRIKSPTKTMTMKKNGMSITAEEVLMSHLKARTYQKRINTRTNKMMMTVRDCIMKVVNLKRRETIMMMTMTIMYSLAMMIKKPDQHLKIKIRPNQCITLNSVNKSKKPKMRHHY